MLPIKDDNPQFQTPIATYSIIAVNLLVWFFFQGFGDDTVLYQSVCKFGLIPADLTNNFSTNTAQWSCPPDDGVGVIGFLTAMFMHGSWMHLLGNMWFLWVFGDNVEDAMGRLSFLKFYFLCGITASLTHVLINFNSAVPMVGASGAIGGVMGAYIVLYPKVRVHLLMILIVFITTIRVPAFLMLGYWAFLQYIGIITSSSGLGGVAHWAHIGGFISGAILVYFFKDQELLAKHPYYGWH
tara:strand:- start:963 stop:1682 length:720 start_codon:yes stop_codon:yes gene_type:complete